MLFQVIFLTYLILSDKEGQVIQDIRYHSIRSLGWIQYHGDNDAQSQLCKLGYAGMMAVAVGICGGCIVNNNGDIKLALSSIGCFFNRIHEGRKTQYFYHHPVPPQPELIKPSEEQLEEEGGNEEIEQWMAKKQKEKYQNIKFRTIQTKYTILNSFCNKLNGQQRYNEHDYYYDEDRNDGINIDDDEM
ncbi:MAG: hypothetical protein EZS28_044761 [Streblomastix strix]|uniref:Transmembrane protein n=1 Tax=Streblomastix strix TaxID=222440 RepID=A0A5J4TPA8_9EUKA|nr:MAG: hypothetical protein EZS28_044761 [Streblomastix strix]